MDANLEGLRARFDADPGDCLAFEALEEAHFLAGEWDALVALYESRLEAPELGAADHAPVRARLVLRLAQVLEERCMDAGRALARFEEAVELDPSHRPALAQLRRLFAQQEQWDRYLQLTQQEAGLPMRPSEQAAFATELGEVWLHKLGDPQQAVTQFETALEADDTYVNAMLGLAEAQKRLHAPELAVVALERAIERLRGVERAPALVSLAVLLRRELNNPERALQAIKRALTDDPTNEAALEAMADSASGESDWDEFDELMERRYQATRDDLRRLAIAHDAGRVQLEERQSADGARRWFERAHDLFPDDPVVHLYLADVARLSGDQDEVARHLRQASILADEATPVEVLHESAQLATDEGDDDFAAEQLQRALARRPDDPVLRSDLIDALQRLGRDGELLELLLTDAEQAETGSAKQLAAWLRVGAHREERLGEIEAAQQDYRRAFDIDPGSEAAGDALARCLTTREAWTELEALHEQVLGASTTSATRRSQAACALGGLFLEHVVDLDAAAAAFQRGLDLDAGCVAAREGLERVALTRGDDDSLLTAFEREARVTSDRERLSFLVWELARIYEDREDPAPALGWLLHLSQAAPEDVRALEGCARLQEQLGEQANLCASLERLDPLLSGAEQAKNRQRLASLWTAVGDRARALDAIRALLEITPDDVDALLELDALLAQAGRVDELIEVRRNLSSLLQGPGRANCLDALADLLIARHQPEDALDALTRLVASGDARPEVAQRRETLLRDLGRWDELCKELVRRREGLDPLDPRAFELDVECAEILLDRIGNAERAVELFDLAREAAPGSERARTGLEAALRQAGRNDRLVVVLEEKAREEADAEQRAELTLERALLLEETLEQLPEAKTVLAEIANGPSALADDAAQRLVALFERTEDWDALREHRAQQLGSGDDAEDCALHLELAELSLERLNDPAQALSHLESAGKLAPERAEIWQQLAALHEQAGDGEATLVALEDELATDPDASRAALLRGRAAELALATLEDDARAERHFAALLELDATHAGAAQFLTDRYEREARHGELVELLERRVVQLTPADLEAGGDASLRLRMAALQAGPLDRLDDAIANLEIPAARDLTLAVVAEPLADLYERAGRGDDLVALARRAAGHCDVAEERATWNLLIADALRREGDASGAADAYRQALADRPSNRAAESALRELYRQLSETEPLIRLLEAELSRVGGPAEIPLRMELAGLLSSDGERGADALVHLRRVIELEPEQTQALDQAIELASEGELHEETLELLSLALKRTRSPLPRARLLARRGAIEADALARPGDALADFQQAVALDPSDGELRARVRQLLEQQSDWWGVLECIERETGRLPASAEAERASLLEEGAGVAATHCSLEASLPWLTRLRSLRADDATVLARIAEVHRAAGRTDALLRAIEEEIALDPAADGRAALECERARLFEQELGAPGRAVRALEAARNADPDAIAVLTDLERLYREAGRTRERAGVLVALAGVCEDDARLGWRRAAAGASRALGELRTSVEHLWEALPDAGEGIDRVEILRELEDLLPRLGRRDLWARVAEAELASLDPQAPVFVERRRELHWLLAESYRKELARPDLALRHLRERLDGESGGEAEAPSRPAEDALLDLLRHFGEAVELEARLSRRLSEDATTDATAWYELGQLRLERLHRLSRAAEAFEQALGADPEHLDALRGLRSCAERLGRQRDVARTLEREIELRPDASAHERAALHRALGELCWRELDSTTRASRAFAAAVEADPDDLTSLRSLQALFETMEDWRGAADLYESEVSVLGDREAARRQEAWLKVAAIARDRLKDLDRALAAFQSASEVAALTLAARHELARLYAQAEQPDRFAEVFASWVDAEGSGASVDEHLELAFALESLGRDEAALARVERAMALDTEHLAAWDAAARLRDRLGRSDAGDAFAHAAACTHGNQAAERRLAAALRTDSDEERARLLDRAVADDPALCEAQAALAVVAAKLGRHAQAERAALRAIEHGDDASLAPETRCEAALAGGLAAQKLGHRPEALSLFGAVLAIDPDHATALAAHGETALEVGDAALARTSLERLLAGADERPDRAAQLARLGRALELEGEHPDALQRFQEALELDPQLDDAHRGLTELLERAGQIDEAVDALQAWAVRASDASVRAGRLLHAAQLELARTGREEPAEALLRESVEHGPKNSEGWILLCDLLWEQDRANDALEQATRGIEALGEVPGVARLALIRGRALEARGDGRAAADSFRTAASRDPLCAEGALSAARLLRALGEWRESADVLRNFIEAAPQDAESEVAPALLQLGRLLAGPLEDVDGAIGVYERALAGDPSLIDAEEALADLLVHRPDHWNDAVARHLALLERDPVRLASLRGLLRVARGREQEKATAIGLALLRALGCATPEERVEAPARMPSSPGGAFLQNPTFEALRQLAIEASDEIGEALGVGAAGDGPPKTPGADPVTRLRSALIEAEGELSSPALVPLSNQEAGQALGLAAALILEVESVQGDGHLVNEMSRTIGRRTRRRLRKSLGQLTPETLAEVDWNAWRMQLRVEAAGVALERVDGELRSAFLAWLETENGSTSENLPPESDLRDRVLAEPQAELFLRRLIDAWRQEL
ncbi:MAG: tetratricopeptide repeat protein [Deltaproteobacteria bacterium]|nr:tetratricopeptide repeat protein [Deltaproteobacteria bacterium]